MVSNFQSMFSLLRLGFSGVMPSTNGGNRADAGGLTGPAEGGDMAKARDASAAGVGIVTPATGLRKRLATRTLDGMCMLHFVAKSNLAMNVTSGPKPR